MNSPRSWTMLGLVIAAAVSRLVPHSPNVAPMAALALFSGAYFASRRMATVVAMGALFLSDLLLHVTFQAGWQPLKGFYPGQWAIYACTLASVSLGVLIRRRRGVATTAAATLAGSVLFFLVTNLVYVYGAGADLSPDPIRGAPLLRGGPAVFPLYPPRRCVLRHGPVRGVRPAEARGSRPSGRGDGAGRGLTENSGNTRFEIRERRFRALPIGDSPRMARFPHSNLGSGALRSPWSPGDAFRSRPGSVMIGAGFGARSSPALTGPEVGP